MKGYKTFVMVLERLTTGDEVHFVTDYDAVKMRVVWDKDAYAVPMSDGKAMKIVEGLRANGFNSSVVHYPDYALPPKNHWIQNV